MQNFTNFGNPVRNSITQEIVIRKYNNEFKSNLLLKFVNLKLGH